MNGINVYSEIGVLKKVLVHRPGDEIRYITPQRMDELLFSALLQTEQAQEEHDRFTKILKDNGVEVVELADLAAEAYEQSSAKVQQKFIEDWLDEAPLTNKEERETIKKYLLSLKPTRKMIDKMMAGILTSEVDLNSKKELIVDPMPNLYFTRDPFSTVGNGITLHRMKHATRQRETLFGDLIFKNHKDYTGTPKYYDRHNKTHIEGGDVFIYTKDVLAIGVSDRTTMDSIKVVAENIKNNKDCKFKKIIAINVPKKGNLMHLDTWLTMLDTNKFLYSSNMDGVLKMWDIDLSKPINPIEIKKTLHEVLDEIVGEKVVLIPVAGSESQMQIDIETHFDATNYLVIRPGLVVGYDRNQATERALIKAGIKVLSFSGNQLSLGMGSSRCMSMPLWREEVK